MAVVDDVRKATRPLLSRITSLIKRVVIERVDDSKKTQAVQVSMLAGEVADKCEHMQPYGFTSHPPRGSEAIALCPGGDPSHVCIICAVSRKHRPTGLKEGENGLHFLGEFKVFLDEGGNVHLGAKEGAAKMARADRVESELEKIKATLDSLTGDSEFSTPYESVGSVGADNVHGT